LMLTGRPKIRSHSEKGLEQQNSSQMSGSQSAPLTLGLSRMSRRKRKTIKASVRKRASRGGRPIKLAMWVATGFTDYEFLNYLRTTLGRSPINPRRGSQRHQFDEAYS